PVAPGQLDLAGPRYCPSIEEKIVRFGHKESHQLFLEPEGWATGELYVQGCFTGLPPSVQIELLRSIPALQEVEMTRPGYAITYDYVLPQQLKPTLETRAIRGLFLAGQINGTSGYEEAAAQGLYAGANAACGVGDVEPLHLGRDQALLGVMIDDLITKELTEPYRMLTSRAEYRMLLRGDNADLRLTPLAYHLGLVDKERQVRVAAKRAAVEGEIARLKTVTLHPSAQLEERLHEAGLPPVAQPVSAHQWLRRPGARYALVAERLPAPTPLSPEAAEQVEIAIQYEGYIQKQERQVERLSRLEQRAIPEGLRYEELKGLSNEARERLAQHRPGTVGQAARIQGVTPADVSVLLVHLDRSRRAQPPDPTSGTSVR
ncbi:MAG: FAD-dependent oxidoreductase, partial [Chloroflexota bacterium]